MAESPPSDRDWIAAAKAFFVAKERAKRFAFRLKEIAKERRLAYAGARAGMTSFADATAALSAVEAEVKATIDDVLGGRLRDRERGETEIPLVAALEGVLERVQRARAAEAARRLLKGSTEALEARLLSLVDASTARLDAFAAVYEEKRIIAAPTSVDVDRVLARVEDDAATTRSARGPHADRLAPRVETSAEAFEDLLRAARTEVLSPRPPWRVARDARGGRLTLSLGGEPAGRSGGLGADEEDEGLGDADRAAGKVFETPSSLGSFGAARARTDRAASVLTFVHGVQVERQTTTDGATTGIVVAIEDASAKAVGERVVSEDELPAHADAAIRGYLLAKGKGMDPFGPGGLVAVMGVLRAVEKELERVLARPLGYSQARVTASRVPRESSRKAPVKKDAVAALEAKYPVFPTHRVDDVLDAVGSGKATAATTKPPDAAVVLAVLGVAPTAGLRFTDRVLPLSPLAEEDVVACVNDVSTLSILRLALERGRSPGEGWEKAFEDAAFGLLRRLAKVA